MNIDVKKGGGYCEVVIEVSLKALVILKQLRMQSTLAQILKISK